MTCSRMLAHENPCWYGLVIWWSMCCHLRVATAAATLTLAYCQHVAAEISVGTATQMSPVVLWLIIFGVSLPSLLMWALV